MNKVKKLIRGIQQKEISLLSQAITLVESEKKSHLLEALELLSFLKGHKKSKIIGISGPPGVGKSSFLESFGTFLTQKKLSVAVLAIDPSSSLSGGSILGDKTRMGALAQSDLAYIRPAPSGGSLGGIGKKTWESILLCEEFGFDYIFVETVGVGQSEILARDLVDMFLFLAQPGSGDELQGIKKGILEVCDAIIVTKADGDNIRLAQQALSYYRETVKLQSGKSPFVSLCSSQEKSGLKEIYQAIEDFFTKQSFQRDKQKKRWVQQMMIDYLISDFQEKMQAQIIPKELKFNNILEHLEKVISNYKKMG